MSAVLAVLDPGAWLSLTVAGVLPQVAAGCRLRFVVAAVHVDRDTKWEAPSDRVFCERFVISGSEEIEWLLEYATAATEGEAAAAALAQCRRLPLISDELKLRRLFSSHTSGAGALLSVAQLLERWEKNGTSDGTSITTAISALRDGAHYSPSRSMPGSEWWKTRVEQPAAPPRK